MTQTVTEKSVPKETVKLKGYAAYSGDDQWYNCVLVFDNGWSPFGHLCSHPSFALNDLWGRRKERQEILAEMGIEVTEIIVCRDVNVPKEVLDKHKNPLNYKHLTEKYNEIYERLHPTPEVADEP